MRAGATDDFGLATGAAEVASINFAAIDVPLAAKLGADFLAVGNFPVFGTDGGNANTFGRLSVTSLALETGAGNASAPAAGNAFGGPRALGNGRNAKCSSNVKFCGQQHLLIRAALGLCQGIAGTSGSQSQLPFI